MKLKRLSALLLMALMFLAIPACVSVGRKIDQSAADKIEKGKTTREQVVSLIGSPEMITRNSNGDTVFIYNYTRSTAKPATFIPYIGPFVGGANTQHQSTSVTFGPDGVVKAFSSTQGSMESNIGLTAGGKADIKDVEEGKRPK